MFKPLKLRAFYHIAAVLIGCTLCFGGAQALSEAQNNQRAAKLEREIVAACCWINVLSEHHSALAVQMKSKIRFLIGQGKTDAQVRTALAEEYGERVLANPKREGFTLVAWIVPPVVLLVAFFLVVTFLRRRTRTHHVENDYSHDEMEAARMELGEDMGKFAIGLVGRNCSGKGAVAQFLQQRGYSYVSLSDALRDELRAQGKEVTRENLIEGGRELRRQFGDGVLADRVLQTLEQAECVLIDSVRNPGEVKSLRQLSNFKLLAVTADDPVRFERMLGRQRESDPRTYEEFLALESKESDASESSAQQVLQTEALADAVIENNGSLEELHAKLENIFRRLQAAA